jgi:hypothetical protein
MGLGAGLVMPAGGGAGSGGAEEVVRHHMAELVVGWIPRWAGRSIGFSFSPLF